MRVLSIETPAHGRVLIKDPVTPSSPRVIVGFHGYAQSAEDMLSELELIPGSDQWTLVSIQALHRFYAKGQRVVASWMTSQDRELAIKDNLAYVDRVIGTLVAPGTAGTPLVFVGFSQGVAMAYRSAVNGTHQAQCVIAVGGDVPPEVKLAPAARFPCVLVAGGNDDPWYTGAKLEADEEFLRSIGVKVDVFRYRGAHEWTPGLRDRVRQFLEDVVD